MASSHAHVCRKCGEVCVSVRERDDARKSAAASAEVAARNKRLLDGAAAELARSQERERAEAEKAALAYLRAVAAEERERVLREALEAAAKSLESAGRMAIQAEHPLSVAGYADTPIASGEHASSEGESP